MEENWLNFWGANLKSFQELNEKQDSSDTIKVVIGTINVLLY